MLFVILSLIVTVGLLVGLGFYEKNVTRIQYGREIEDTEWAWKVQKKQFLAVFGLLIMLFGCITKIPANHVGIVYSPFGGTKEQTLAEGFQTKNVLDKIYKISTEVQTMQIGGLTTQTKDAQYLTSALDVKYKVSASNAFVIFKQYRTLDNMSDNLIIPTTQRVLELVTTKYNVIDILGEKRSAVYTEFEAALKEEFNKYGVEFVSITIADMDAGDALENAITEEAVAKKAVETAEQNLLKAEKEAKQKSVQAQAEQDAARIEAETKLIEAEAEKKANEMLNQTLTDEILKQQWIEKWDSHLPTYYGGDADLMIGVGGIE